eukprot:4965019-Pleurochrysis_carterae.AAC.5
MFPRRCSTSRTRSRTRRLATAAPSSWATKSRRAGACLSPCPEMPPLCANTPPPPALLGGFQLYSPPASSRAARASTAAASLDHASVIDDVRPCAPIPPCSSHLISSCAAASCAAGGARRGSRHRAPLLLRGDHAKPHLRAERRQLCRGGRVACGARLALWRLESRVRKARHVRLHRLLRRRAARRGALGMDAQKGTGAQLRRPGPKVVLCIAGPASCRV